MRIRLLPVNSSRAGDHDEDQSQREADPGEPSRRAVPECRARRDRRRQHRAEADERPAKTPSTNNVTAGAVAFVTPFVSTSAAISDGV
jgi:hypothetical protein